MRRALITGVTGQDGAYLARLLLDKGYKVYGTFRRTSSPTFWRLQSLGIQERVHLIAADLADAGSLTQAIRISEPDEVYHLAAMSFVGTSFDQPVFTGDITGLGVTRLLDTIRLVNPNTKFYQASSSEMFGDGSTDLRDERSDFSPASPYAAAKLYGFWITRVYRDAFKIFAANGILFNHESPLRSLEFVTRKITNAVAMITLGVAKEVRLGNLNAMRDWGYAPEYVQAMWDIMQLETPDDFVIATGEAHSVREFADEAFSIAGLDWKKYVKIDKKLFRPLDVPSLRGDFSKAKRVFRWEPRTTFSELVKIMVEADLNRWKDALSGKVFPWDVSFSTNLDQPSNSDYTFNGLQ